MWRWLWREGGGGRSKRPFVTHHAPRWMGGRTEGWEGARRKRPRGKRGLFAPDRREGKKRCREESCRDVEMKEGTGSGWKNHLNQLPPFFRQRLFSPRSFSGSAHSFAPISTRVAAPAVQQGACENRLRGQKSCVCVCVVVITALLWVCVCVCVSLSRSTEMTMQQLG